jgi:hypothetical protein
MRKIQPAFLAVAVAAWLPLLAFSTVLSGCQTGTSGILRPLSANAEHSITNVVQIASSTAGAVLPSPYGTGAELIGAALLAALAAWQGMTHGKVKTLENHNPTVNLTPKT